MKACAHAFSAVAMTAAACAFAGDYNYNFISHPATGINAHGIASIFSGVLPVGSGSPPMWIARDAHGYVMFTILSPSMVSGVGVPEQMGAQTYEKARRGGP